MGGKQKKVATNSTGAVSRRARKTRKGLRESGENRDVTVALYPRRNISQGIIKKNSIIWKSVDSGRIGGTQEKSQLIVFPKWVNLADGSKR